MDTPRIEVTRFLPPYAHRAQEPKGFSYHWMQLQFLFNLPDPYGFPAVDGFTEDDRNALSRYARNCAELAESTLLSYDGSLTMRVDGKNGEMQTELDTVSRELLRGGAVLFRLVSSDTEVGGQGQAHKIVERRVHESQNTDVLRQVDTLKAWRRARGKLKTRMLSNMAYEKMFEMRLGGYEADPSKPGPSPTQLISLFDYGDLIHQGKHLDAFEASRRDVTSHARASFDHVAAVLQLSHFYLGYSVLVESALGRSDDERL